MLRVCKAGHLTGTKYCHICPTDLVSGNPAPAEYELGGRFKNVQPLHRKLIGQQRWRWLAWRELRPKKHTRGRSGGVGGSSATRLSEDIQDGCVAMAKRGTVPGIRRLESNPGSQSHWTHKRQDM